MSQGKLGMIAVAITASLFLLPFAVILTYHEPTKTAAEGRRPARDAINGSNVGMVPREKFRADVVGKTRDQTMEMYGQPNSISEGVACDFWVYYRRTYSPVTGNPDLTAVLRFPAGKALCESVSFQD